MTIIQVSEAKKEKLTSYAEGIMSMAEKLVDCIESLEETSPAGERSRYGRPAQMSMPMDDDYESERYAGRRSGRR